jgi:hypothetical protein
VVAIAAGGYHSLALRSDGTVWAWGYNVYGQLGNNSTTNSSVPVQVQGLTRITQIAAGALHSLAIDASGRLWAWGYDYWGQLGDGTNNNRTVPAQITSLGNGAQALATGSSALHTLIIGQPYASLSTTKLTYGAQQVGTTSTSLPVTVTNKGSVALTFAQATIVGQDGDEFTFAGDGCSATTVKPAASCQISIRFTPKVSGNPVATLRIPSNSPTSPDLVTLDPHAYDTQARTHPLGCVLVRSTRRLLVVRCRTLWRLGAGAHRVSISLAGQRAGGVIRGSAGSVTLRLPRPRRAGAYALMLRTTRPSMRWMQTIRLRGQTAAGEPRAGSASDVKNESGRRRWRG